MASSSRSLGDPTYGGPGFDVVERTRRTIERRDLLEAGDKVLVACSGGPDSICLLDVLARLQDPLDLDLIVAHVDHGLSPESEQIAARLSSAVAAAGFEIHVGRAPALDGPNLQARARDFRYEFLNIIATKEGARRIATGHTLDDRVETTVARLIHGAGTSGLAGIPPAEGNRIRPLIDSRRMESRAYCEECGLDFYDDPANEDDRFERVAVRTKVLTAIEDHWGSGAIRAMASSADRLSEDAKALAEISARLYKDIGRVEDEWLTFERDALLGMPRALRRRMFELAIGRVRDRSGGIEAALDALEGPSEKPAQDARFAVASGIEIHLLADKVQVRHDA